VMNSRRRTRYLAEPSRQDRRCARDKRISDGVSHARRRSHFPIVEIPRLGENTAPYSARRLPQFTKQYTRRRLAWVEAEPSFATATSDAEVRCGSITSVLRHPTEVRFTLNYGHRSVSQRATRRAITGHRRTEIFDVCFRGEPLVRSERKNPPKELYVASGQG
jgi:hypothetical protein